MEGDVLRKKESGTMEVDIQSHSNDKARQRKLQQINDIVMGMDNSYTQEKRVLQNKYKVAIDKGTNEITLSKLQTVNEWHMRQLFVNTHKLSTIQTPLRILRDDDTTDKEKYRLLREFMDSLVDKVMSEDTLNFTTSPETTLDRRAQGMAYREIYRSLRYKI